MMLWRDSGVPADSFYEARPECPEGLTSKFKIKAGKTLSVRRWQAAFSPDGYLDIASVLSRIQRGGVHPSIRGEVWEFLLGCFDPKSTTEEREELRQQRRVQYERWKDVCKELDSHVGSGIIVTAPLITEDGQPIHDPLVLIEASPNQTPSHVSSGAGSPDDICMEKKVIEWKLTLHQIGLDVLRTDRSLVFYENKENLSKLWDILAVYAWIDKDVGYCQGMSDLCSPMIILLEDEADSFWCFERLMRKLPLSTLSKEFEMEASKNKGEEKRCTDRSVGVENQLQSLASITQILDPKLHQHLETLGGGDYLFAVRMFMVLFRRELSFGDSLYLWEMMWALEYHPDIFILYEEPEFLSENSDDSKRKVKIRQFGKFERDNIRNGTKTAEAPLPITVFLVASVLKEKSTKLLQEARGLDDVVKILNDTSGDLDAKKACCNAIKLHKKYLKMAKNP